MDVDCILVLILVLVVLMADHVLWMETRVILMFLIVDRVWIMLGFRVIHEHACIRLEVCVSWIVCI